MPRSESHQLRGDDKSGDVNILTLGALFSTTFKVWSKPGRMSPAVDSIICYLHIMLCVQKSIALLRP